MQALLEPVMVRNDVQSGARPLRRWHRWLHPKAAELDRRRARVTDRPGNSTLRLRLAETLTQVGNIAEAIDQYESAARLFGEAGDARRASGALLTAWRRALRELPELSAPFARLTAELLAVELEQGFAADAEALLERALADLRSHHCEQEAAMLLGHAERIFAERKAPPASERRRVA